MVDLRVDYQLLDSISGTLGSIIPEIEGMSDNVSDCDWAYGSGDIAGAMGGFANNWSKHKSQMVSNMKTFQSMVQQTSQGFQKTDDKLTTELTSKTKKD
jgi:hypothetical protein